MWDDQKYRKYTYTLEIATVSIMMGKPAFVNSMKDMFALFLAPIWAMTTFAEAPMSVPLPPRQAPNARAQ